MNNNFIIKRLESGLSLEELSKKSGIELKIIKQIEEGNKKIEYLPFIDFLKLAVILDCSFLDLIDPGTIARTYLTIYNLMVVKDRY